MVVLNPIVIDCFYTRKLYSSTLVSLLLLIYIKIYLIVHRKKKGFSLLFIIAPCWYLLRLLV